MKRLAGNLAMSFAFSLNVSAANLVFECKSQMTIGLYKSEYSGYSFSSQPGCVSADDAPIALLKFKLDTETLYGEVHEVRCNNQTFSAFQSWGQRAKVEALPKVYRFATPNPLPTGSGLFFYDLTREASPKATMNRQGWAFDCSMEEVEVERPAF